MIEDLEIELGLEVEADTAERVATLEDLVALFLPRHGGEQAWTGPMLRIVPGNEGNGALC